MDQLRDTIHDASRGDRSALEALLARYLPQLQAFARLHMGPLALHESSSDIVQSVCRQVLQDLDRVEYRGEAAFRGWLFATCTSRIRDHLKYQLRERRDVRRNRTIADSVVTYVDELPTPSGEVMKREELQQLERALDQLPDEYRQVVTMSRLLGLPHAEIAEQIGKSEGATRMLLHRAVARLGIEMVNAARS